MLAALGRNLRKLRRQQNLSLLELSSLSGVSRSTLSDIERSAKSPTIDTLYKIAHALEVNLVDLLSPKEDPFVEITRYKERSILSGPNYQVHGQVVSLPLHNHGIELLSFNVPPGSTTGMISPLKKGTKKCYWVHSGKAELIIGDKSYELSSGDSAYFEADVEHQLTSTSDVISTLYLVIVHPWG